jgi:hypothetical protein
MPWNRLAFGNRTAIRDPYPGAILGLAHYALRAQSSRQPKEEARVWTLGAEGQMLRLVVVCAMAFLLINCAEEHVTTPPALVGKTCWGTYSTFPRHHRNRYVWDDGAVVFHFLENGVEYWRKYGADYSPDRPTSLVGYEYVGVSDIHRDVRGPTIVLPQSRNGVVVTGRLEAEQAALRWTLLRQEPNHLTAESDDRLFYYRVELHCSSDEIPSS